MLTLLDEFAGIRGATLAGDSLGIKTTQFVEIDEVNAAAGGSLRQNVDPDA